jgi:hypothetical protein
MSFPNEAEYFRIFGEPYSGEFKPSNEMHVRAVVPYELAPVIQKILEGEAFTEELRNELLQACKARWNDI